MQAGVVTEVELTECVFWFLVSSRPLLHLFWPLDVVEHAFVLFCLKILGFGFLCFKPEDLSELIDQLLFSSLFDFMDTDTSLFLNLFALDLVSGI